MATGHFHYFTSLSSPTTTTAMLDNADYTIQSNCRKTWKIQNPYLVKLGHFITLYAIEIFN